MVVWFSGEKNFELTLRYVVQILSSHFYAYNKWLEVIQVKATTITVTKQHLMNFFTCYGPKALVSDNETCFTS